ncbi:NAD(P)H-hydrate dehydratase [Candidatus Woesearchaeota archaeon]|nr:NAD(P)H-hydrate dehydratase [Candidatus Woesearchaeota archaeon]MBW3014554.1 NAD(P)H-hydrate dehydratase [Candidatus Woesearchaeota archaeon]
MSVPARKKDSHKGQNGIVLVIGGSELYVGAPALAAMAALRTGVDLVYVATTIDAAYAINTYDPSLITIKCDGPILTDKHYHDLEPFIQRADCIIIGPGMGTEKGTEKLIKKIAALNKPKVIDADALKVLRAEKINNAVLTPHRGEFQALYGAEPTEDNLPVYADANRIILLKGQVDLITDGKKIHKNKFGNPGMTVGGTGDVLAGIIGGLIALKTPLLDAARYGAEINGLVGDKLQDQIGYSFTPYDIIKNLGYIVKKYVR